MANVLQLRSNEWYQLKISLNYINPLIWRRLVVKSDITLPELHKIIQTVMGWSNCHLHQFSANGKLYSEPDKKSLLEYIDYRKINLNQVLSKKQPITYIYDFGDGWEHEIELEKILPNHIKEHPYCIDGERSCPPEACGGPPGYEELLRIISDSGDDEYDEVLEWLDDSFHAEYFDIDEINNMLKNEDYGCITNE